MTEVPKIVPPIVPTIVHDRLRASGTKLALPGQTAPAQTHPDADVLAAFAEQALSATERDDVLEHLARCGDCRELLALALPAADIGGAPIAVETDGAGATGARAGAPAPHKLNFAWPTLAWPALRWPTLRWAALAAGVAVAAAVLLVHPGKLNQVALNKVALPSANRAAVKVASGPQVAASPPASSAVTPSTDQLAVLAKSEEAQPKPEMRSSKKLKAGRSVTPSRQAEHGIVVADNKKDLGQADRLPAAPSAQARAFNFNARANRGATETVEVTGAAVGLETEFSNLKTMARNEVPAIEKAKPAPQGIEGNRLQKNEAAAASGTAMLQARNVTSAGKLTRAAGPALATWAIAEGVLQRSLDSGNSWQSALRAERPLLCYASRDQEVWTGGQAGTLFHSADNGLTWVQVQASIKAQSLTSDITHIDIRGPAEVVISTSDREIWSSADRGKTWEKK